MKLSQDEQIASYVDMLNKKAGHNNEHQDLMDKYCTKDMITSKDPSEEPQCH